VPWSALRCARLRLNVRLALVLESGQRQLPLYR